MSAEPAITDLLARIAELTRLLNTVQGEVRVLAAMPPAPARDRRLADLYREYGMDVDAIIDACAQAMISQH